jgi:hypothetical protein
VNIPTFLQTSPEELLKRFPVEPGCELEPPQLRDPNWRREIEEALRRDDLLDDEECRQQIRELTREPGWLDDLRVRRQVGELLHQGHWGEKQRFYLQQWLADLLQQVAWQQNEEYRRRVKEPLLDVDPNTLQRKAHSLTRLQGELFRFLKLLETAPSLALLAHPPPPLKRPPVWLCSPTPRHPQSRAKESRGKAKGVAPTATELRNNPKP